MEVFRAQLVFLSVVLASLRLTALAQQSNPPPPKPTPGVIKAGEPFGLDIEVLYPYNVDADLTGCFFKKSVPMGRNDEEFCCTKRLSASQSLATLECATPHDLVGGEYLFSGSIAVSRLGYVNSGTIGAPPFSVKIIAEEAQPHEANRNQSSVTLNLSETQILRGKAQSLQGVEDALTDTATTALDKTADTKALREDLVDAIRMADALVLDAEKSILRLRRAQSSPQDVMFEDFHRHYAASLVELRASIPPAYQAPSHVELAAFQQIPKSSDSVTVTGSKGKYSHSFGLVATAVLDLISENIVAFKKAAESATDEFHLPIKSSPDNARIYYVRIGEQEQEYGTPTNVESASIPFAKWTFIFRKQGCADRSIAPNLYSSESEGVEVTLICKKAK